MITEKLTQGKLTQQDRDILKQIRAAQAVQAKGRAPYKPRPRVRRPWLGTLNWERHKAKQASKRKARNIQARKTRKAQRRAG